MLTPRVEKNSITIIVADRSFRAVLALVVRKLAAVERIEFAVADTGIGIDRESLNRVFDEFYQLQDAHTGNFDGFDLGLNIVKKYLELMGGDIRVESEVGAGSTFTFTFLML